MGMLALDTGIERQRLALRDREVRLRSIQNDIRLGLPHSIQLPDGEEYQFYRSANLPRPLFRRFDQENEVRNYIKPPPNKTICSSDSSALLSFNSSRSNSSTNIINSNNDWSSDVLRCHSVSSKRYVVNVPVILPDTVSHSRPHQVSIGLSKITMVPCFTDQRLTISANESLSVAVNSSESPSSSTTFVNSSSTTTTDCNE